MSTKLSNKQEKNFPRYLPFKVCPESKPCAWIFKSFILFVHLIVINKNPELQWRILFSFRDTVASKVAYNDIHPTIIRFTTANWLLAGWLLLQVQLLAKPQATPGFHIWNSTASVFGCAIYWNHE